MTGTTATISGSKTYFYMSYILMEAKSCHLITKLKNRVCFVLLLGFFVVVVFFGGARGCVCCRGN